MYNSPFPGEYNLPFSSFCDPYSNHFYYYQPSIDKEWLNSLEQCKEIREKKYNTICIYTGKGKLKEIPKSLRSILNATDSKDDEIQKILNQNFEIPITVASKLVHSEIGNLSLIHI